MVGKFRKINPSASEQEDSEYSPENSGDSPRSGSFGDSKITSTSSPKSRRGIKKRVVSVPITDVEGSRLKGESAPPSDSWAWRKYGQKPIKGSPYPRGYYRCSSSKGCPARKQVERSRVDPTTVVVTYSCEHNHPSPASKNGNNHHHHRQSGRRGSASNPPAVEAADEGTRSASATVSNSDDDRPAVFEEERLEFANLGDESLSGGYDFRWLSEFEATSSMMLESPIFDGDDGGAVIYTMREEDESLFADLEELPECSVVFRRGTGVKVERTVL